MSELNDSEKILLYVKTLRKYLVLNENMKNTNPEEFQTKLHEKFGSFRERYPTLFQILVDNTRGFEESRLIEMLRMRERVSQKNVSYENASIQIGQRYFDEFVKPIVGTDTGTGNPAQESVNQIRDMLLQGKK
jgi:hypothetical protein